MNVVVDIVWKLSLWLCCNVLIVIHLNGVESRLVQICLVVEIVFNNNHMTCTFAYVLAKCCCIVGGNYCKGMLICWALPAAQNVIKRITSTLLTPT